MAGEKYKNMVVTVDDLCLSYLDNFKHIDSIKRKHNEFKIIAFTIANYKNMEPLCESDLFAHWFADRKDWVEIAVHSYDHDGIPDGDRENEEFWIEKARDSLRLFLPKFFGYRSPGWQTTNKTVGILKSLGFSYIAYENKIRSLKTETIIDTTVLNSHLYDTESIKRLEVNYENLKSIYKEQCGNDGLSQ